MRFIRSRITAAAVALLSAISWVAPAQALQPRSAPVAALESPVTEVQDRRGPGEFRRRPPQARPGGPRADGPRFRPGPQVRRDGPRFRPGPQVDRRGPGWHNGHRGYRDRRPGYRYHNGFWFPLAAFAAGAIISSAARAEPRSLSGRHYQWCANRYRSYRASDNTYAPRVGVRAVCVSPYS